MNRCYAHFATPCKHRDWKIINSGKTYLSNDIDWCCFLSALELSGAIDMGFVTGLDVAVKEALQIP